jgi:hypothetical protein
MPLYSKVKVGGSRLKEETIISIALSFVGGAQRQTSLSTQQALSRNK